VEHEEKGVLTAYYKTRFVVPKEVIPVGFLLLVLAQMCRLYMASDFQYS